MDCDPLTPHRPASTSCEEPSRADVGGRGPRAPDPGYQLCCLESVGGMRGHGRDDQRIAAGRGQLSRSRTPTARTRSRSFPAEARIHARLDHPSHLPPVYEPRHRRKAPVFTMKRLAGPRCRSASRRRQPSRCCARSSTSVSPNPARALARRFVASRSQTVEHHARRRRRGVLLDWGGRAPGSPTAICTTTLPQMGGRRSTGHHRGRDPRRPAYMSPEQILGLYVRRRHPTVVRARLDSCSSSSPAGAASRCDARSRPRSRTLRRLRRSAPPIAPRPPLARRCLLRTRSLRLQRSAHRAASSRTACRRTSTASATSAPLSLAAETALSRLWTQL